MALYKRRPIALTTVEATQWFKNGDHPEDGDETFVDSAGVTQRCEGKVVRYYRRPDVSGEEVCEHCGHTMHEHGWIDNGDCVVCPGDYTITTPWDESRPYDSVRRAAFEAAYVLADSGCREAGI